MPYGFWPTVRSNSGYDVSVICLLHSGVFGGGMVPPLWPSHENFLQATLYEKVCFLPFSSKNCKIKQCLMVFFIPIQYAIKIAMWDCIWYDTDFLRFQISEKMGKFAAFIERSKAKSVPALPPWPSDQGLCPGPRWGLCPQTPVIGSCSARSPCPPLPNPKYATASTHVLWLSSTCISYAENCLNK